MGAQPQETRERILLAASELFARRGYHGTSTREIARAVGVQQPSLFHHFPSKASILLALTDIDLDQAVPAAEQLALGVGPAAFRLYRYLVYDIEHVAASPYNLSGLYTQEIATDSEFEAAHRKLRRLHAAIEAMVEDGVRSGEFLDISPPLVRDAIVGVLLRTISVYSGGRSEVDSELGDRVARFLLRAIVRDSSAVETMFR